MDQSWRHGTQEIFIQIQIHEGAAQVQRQLHQRAEWQVHLRPRVIPWSRCSIEPKKPKPKPRERPQRLRERRPVTPLDSLERPGDGGLRGGHQRRRRGVGRRVRLGNGRELGHEPEPARVSVEVQARLEGGDEGLHPRWAASQERRRERHDGLVGTEGAGVDAPQVLARQGQQIRPRLLQLAQPEAAAGGPLVGDQVVGDELTMSGLVLIHE